MSDLHVLIAGGGVGGLCLAQGLRKAGVSCAVYEQAMRDYVHPIMDLSADHSRFGGGGLRQRSEA